MDCTLIPFLINKLTESIYPLKINEYLAAGKAVVSSSFSEDILSFADHIHLADDESNFINLIDIAISDNSPERIAERIKVAESNTWTARVKEFWQIVNNHLPSFEQVNPQPTIVDTK